MPVDRKKPSRSRIDREKRTVEYMVGLYCRKKEGYPIPCAECAGLFGQRETELPPLSRSLLPAGHAGKDETRHAFLGAAHAALLSPEGDRSLARGDLRTMIVCHGPADKP